MKRLFLLLFCAATAATAHAQGTRLWTQSRYDELQKGTAQGVAIRSDGRLEPAPTTRLVSTTPATYIWSLDADARGNAYLGTGSGSGSPATLLRITPNGKTTKLAEFKELAVQAVYAAPDGSLYAATSPDGKVYRLPANSAAGAKPEVVFDPGQTSEKSKYIWALGFDEKRNFLYIGTGAPAAIYRINIRNAAAKPELFFKSDDQHIRCIVVAPEGTLYAGSDGSGVIYRIKPDGKSFAIYTAPKREITSLTLDAAGNLYASAVGGKAPLNLPPLAVQGNVSVTTTITYAAPGSANAANANTIIPDGSDIYRIAPDGTPQKLITLRDDIVYALVLRNGKLLAATGNKGHIYTIGTDNTGRFTDIAHLDANQAIAFAPASTASAGGLYIATSNTGKLWLLSDQKASSATYPIQVFDAQAFSQWGRMEVRADNPAGIDFYARSGNVENPKGAWSDWQKVSAPADAKSDDMWKSGAPVNIPPARFAQWKAVFKPESKQSGALESVSINYLPANVAPVVDEVVVLTGARVVAANAAATQGATVAIGFAASQQSNLLNFQQDPNTAPLVAQKDKTGVTARWLAHDDNGDDLAFALYYRGDHEDNWQLLKDKITDRFYSFDSALLPDGGYKLKVVASDAPSHTPSDALTGEQISPHFDIDTTAPMLTALKSELVHAHDCGTPPCSTSTLIHATLDAQDTTSPIAHAEYSIDAGPWLYLEPTHKISDSLTEHYDFTAIVPAPQPGALQPVNPNEHILSVRVYDRYENMSAIKAIVK